MYLNHPVMNSICNGMNPFDESVGQLAYDPPFGKSVKIFLIMLIISTASIRVE